jgi:malate dehydrogenase
MPFIAIIGAGDLGGAAAQALASRDRVRRLLLVDPAADAAAGKALDIRQSGGVDAFHAQLTATADLAAVAGAAACVVADRFGPPSAEWLGDEGLATMGRLVPWLGDAPIVFAGPQQLQLMHRVAREQGLPPQRLIGSAPEAYASAVRAIVALEAECSPSEIMLAVLGTPEGGFVVPWSEAAVAGYTLDRVLSQVQLARVEARAARLWPPGPLTLGAAAARVAEAIATSSRGTFSAFGVLDGEFGVRGRIGALPVRLSRHGVAAVRVPVLNTRERVRLETSLAFGGP